MRTDNNVRDQKMPGKIRSKKDLSVEENAETRVEEGMERKAESSVEKEVEDAINKKYTASLAAVNIEEVQEVQAVGYVIPTPLQVHAPVTILPIPVQPMSEPVQKKKQLTPEELRAIEIAAEMRVEKSVEKQAEMNVEYAAEMAVEKNYFSTAEAGAKSMTEINSVAREVARQKSIQPIAPVAVVAAAIPEAVVRPVTNVPNAKVETIVGEVKNTAARTVHAPKAASTPRIILDPKILQARKQPKSLQEEAMLQAKYSSMEPGERAFAILLDLGMIIAHPDPVSPGYDSTFDNDFVQSGELV